MNTLFSGGKSSSWRKKDDDDDDEGNNNPNNNRSDTTNTNFNNNNTYQQQSRRSRAARETDPLLTSSTVLRSRRMSPSHIDPNNNNASSSNDQNQQHAYSAGTTAATEQQHQALHLTNEPTVNTNNENTNNDMDDNETRQPFVYESMSNRIESSSTESSSASNHGGGGNVSDLPASTATRITTATANTNAPRITTSDNRNATNTDDYDDDGVPPPFIPGGAQPPPPRPSTTRTLSVNTGTADTTTTNNNAAINDDRRSGNNNNHPQQQLVRSGNSNHNRPIQHEHSHQQQPHLLEIPEEVYAVRKAALQVLKPLTKTWVVISVGFSLTVLFGMARWTRLLPGLPFWFILFPSWAAHGGLVFLHVKSAQALSAFIAEANESRQRPDSRDHLNRTEYLPLLQRSLKFGLKTGMLSFVMFVLEILIYVRLESMQHHSSNYNNNNNNADAAKSVISLTTVFMPLWLLVLGGLVDGLVCKTQHTVRVICWMLTLCAMLLLVLKIDYGMDDVIRWRMVVSPIVLVLSIASGCLVYIVYGHQVGYYQLTESQLTAGNLYSLAALICIVLVVMIGEVIPLTRPVEVETRLFVVILAPLVVCLVGMGAWVVSRDEFGRLLLYGGQAAVHPMKLRWDAQNGWTSVQGRGVTVMPMFGEVSFQPLQRPNSYSHARGDDDDHDDRNHHHQSTQVLEMCTCCSGRCYPYEEEDEIETEHALLDGYASLRNHPYLDDPSSSRAVVISATASPSANNV